MKILILVLINVNLVFVLEQIYLHKFKIVFHYKQTLMEMILFSQLMANAIKKHMIKTFHVKILIKLNSDVFPQEINYVI